MKMRLESFFEIGMDRALPVLKGATGDVRINLGIGYKEMPEGVVSIGLPEWDANEMLIPYDNETVDEIWALHFLEHVNDPMAILMDCQRVLKPGGIMNICVPYGACHMYVHDLTHQHMFNEDTWRQTFRNQYYGDKGTDADWKFEIGLNVIMAVKGENLALLTQLTKEQS
jgi:predicted SAM-dependent methyltransferase